MTGKDLEKLLAEYTSLGTAFLDHVGRMMRAMNMLTTAGRGPHAPHLTTRQVADFLIVATTANTPQEAPAKVRQYRAAPASWNGIGPRSRPTPFKGCKTLGDAITALIEGAALAKDFNGLEITRDYPRATIRAGKRLHYYGAVGNEARKAGYRPVSSCVVFKLSRATFHAIMGEMQDDDTGLSWGR